MPWLPRPFVGAAKFICATAERFLTCLGDLGLAVRPISRPGASKNEIVLAGDKGYDNILRYLQPHAPDSAEFKEINGTRQRAEAMHSIIDNMLPFKRLQRWSLESKQAWVFGYLTGHRRNRLYLG